MSNMKIGLKLTIGFGLLLTLTIIITIVGAISISHINNNYSYVLNYPNDRYSILRDLESELSDLRRLVVQASFLSGNVDAVDALYNESNEAYRSIQATIDEYTQSIWRDTEIEEATRNVMLNELAQLEQLIIDYSRHVSTPTFVAARADNYNQVSALLPLNTAVSDDIRTQFMGIFAITQDRMDAIGGEMATLATGTMWIVVVLAFITLIVGVFVAFIITRSITKPIDEVVSVLSDVADGNLQARNIDLYKNRTDEIGRLFGVYVGVIDWLNEISGAVKALANGDLNIHVNVRSEYDTLNKSIQKMVDDLNDMFGEINNASHQVASGSQQIADGSQTLAQGSTEQAATVQQLSASTTEVAEKTKANAVMAGKAAELAKTIRGNAEKGSKQMDDMVVAVGEISQASQSISKVIKVIDDIAFQTNILALNAAVEAARAGQHGKGFAVVADEVRTLAAKSAEAAKDTGALISNSMEKSEHGARIAKDTAESLAEIVSGINESSEIVGEIAMSSEAQTAGIAQTNSGIDQVASIVQQNSATAEESAAAAEELSGQSTMLKDLIGRFKLKGQNVGNYSQAQHTSPVVGSDSTSFSMSADGKY